MIAIKCATDGLFDLAGIRCGAVAASDRPRTVAQRSDLAALKWPFDSSIKVKRCENWRFVSLAAASAQANNEQPPFNTKNQANEVKD